MRCKGVDRVKPLDKLLDEKIGEFGRGGERAWDRELDEMIWKFGQLEPEEGSQAREEFEDLGQHPAMEEELVEGTISPGRRGGFSFREERHDGDQPVAGVHIPSACPLCPGNPK